MIIPVPVLAVEAEKILGVVQLKLHEMDICPERESWMGSLFVEPKYRGKGIDSALANKIVTIAADFGIKELYLQTEAVDGGLYQQLGWHSIKTVRSRGVDVTVMVRKIDV